MNNEVENYAIGVAPLAEVQRIMRNKPQYVVEMESPFSTINRRTWDYMQAELARDYRPVFVARVGMHFRIIYGRLPGH